MDRMLHYHKRMDYFLTRHLQRWPTLRSPSGYFFHEDLYHEAFPMRKTYHDQVERYFQPDPEEDDEIDLFTEYLSSMQAQQEALAVAADDFFVQQQLPVHIWGAHEVTTYKNMEDDVDLLNMILNELMYPQAHKPTTFSLIGLHQWDMYLSLIHI